MTPHGRPDALARWSEVLDQLEARLADGGDFVPPRGLPPLPGALRPRAADLLARQRRRRDAMDAELADMAAELRSLRAAGRRAGGPATGAADAAPLATRTDARI